MALVNHNYLVTTTGADGSGAGSATTGPLKGTLKQVFLNYGSTAPATTDVTISYAAPLVGNILVVSNNATDGVYRPKLRAVDNSAGTTNVDYDSFVLNGKLTITLAQCNALDPAIEVIFMVDE